MEDQEHPLRRPEWCPGCGSSNVRGVLAGDRTNFLCRECGCCWHLEADNFHAVEPRDCPGCSSRPVCVRRMWESIEWIGPAGGHDRGDAARRELWP